ncbi:MAG: serine/threonine-protein kinase [Acidobacteriota bacterium]
MHADQTPWPPLELPTTPDVFGSETRYCPVCGEAFSPVWERCPDDGTDLVIGTLLDQRFRIVRPIAEGAMGVVYEGVQLPIQRPVAIKLMRDELGRDPHAVQRFLREAHLLTSVSHPNVVEVYDYGESSDGRLYLVMELLRGPTLDVALHAAGSFTVRRTCEIALQLSDALVAAHAQGVVHRDLKPQNVMLLPELGELVKVLDFGLAKPVLADAASELTSVGVVLGTPLYMAPEAVRCAATDPRTDLYALGCIIHELLTGVPAFSGASSNLVLVRQLDDPPPALPPHVPAALRLLVERLLSKSPEHRPASAFEVREHLAACLAAELASDEVLTVTHAALPTVILRKP